MDAEAPQIPEKQGWLCSVPSPQGNIISLRQTVQPSRSGNPSPKRPVFTGLVRAQLDGKSLSFYATQALPYATFSHSSVNSTAGSHTATSSAATHIAQTVLGSKELSDIEWAALPLANHPCDVAVALHIDINEAAAEHLSVSSSSSPSDRATKASVRSHAASRVARYVNAVIQYPGLVLNSDVFAALNVLGNALFALSDATAEQVKRNLQRALATAQEVSAVVGPIDRNAKDNISLLARSRTTAQLWLPPEYFMDNSFHTRLTEEIAMFHHAFWQKWPPTKDASLLFHGTASASTWRRNPLVFDPVAGAPHFLSRLVTAHALSAALGPLERGQLLERWVKLGVDLQSRGDIVGWTAVARAVLHPTILRLRDAWAYVSVEARTTVATDWAYEVYVLDQRAHMPVMEKRTFRTSTEHMGKRYAAGAAVPYFGDLFVETSSSFSDVSAELGRVHAVFDGWAAYAASQHDSVAFPPPLQPSEPFQELLSSWNTASASAPSPTTQFESSLAVQPRFMGSYRAFFYTHQLPLSPESLRPLLFTEVSPTFRLFPRQALLMRSPSSSSSSSATAVSGTHAHPHNHHRSHHSHHHHSHPQTLKRSNSYPPASVLATGVREIELEARHQFESRASAHVLAFVVRDLLNVGTETIDSHADVVFKHLPEAQPARGSRASSVIESLGRRSILLDPRRQSIQSLTLDSHAPARQVVVKAASLVRLVDVLVVGAAAFAPGTQLDAGTHMATLLATFRSFCSPPELLSMLLRRAEGAMYAAKAVTSGSELRWVQIPNPATASAQADEEEDPHTLRVAAQIVGNTIETLKAWVQDYFFDFSDDNVVMADMDRALVTVRTAATRPGFPENLADSARRLAATFHKQRYRVPTPLRPPPSYPRPTTVVNLPVVALEPDGGLVVIERLVEDLDVLVADAFSRVTLADWMKVFEVLELQAAQHGGLFCSIPPAPPQSGPDEIIVQDVYTWLDGLYDPTTRASIVDILPPNFAAIMSLHRSLVAYFVHQLADPALASFPRDRSDRMVFVLKTLGVLRARMRYFDLFPDATDTEIENSRVPSFLESVLKTALLRPESRQFAHSWLSAGLVVAQQFAPADAVSSTAAPNAQHIYIPAVPNSALTGASSRPITPCAGWIVSRLLEIACCVPNMSIDHHELINFDKRRYAFNLVRNIHSEFVVGAAPPPDQDVDRVAMNFAFLLQPVTAVGPLDRKTLKESLHREFHGLAKSQHKQRVFTDVVSSEALRQKQDLRRPQSSSVSADGGGGWGAIPASQSSSSLTSRRFSRLVPSSASTYSLSSGATLGTGHMGSQGISQSVSTTGSAGQQLGMSPPPSSGSISRGGRSRLGGFLKAVRPLSMLGSVPHMQQQQQISDEPEGQIDPASLPEFANLPPLSDPYWRQVLHTDLASISVASLGGQNPEVLVLKRGPETLLVIQAPSATEAAVWLTKLDKACRTAAEASPRVFGVPLEVVIAREKRPVPLAFETMLERIEDVGLEEVGLYRISGSVAVVNALLAAFDAGQNPLDANNSLCDDVNAIAGCVKKYLRDLPEPILTNDLFSEFMACAKSPSVVSALTRASAQLPAANFALLQRLMRHLALVVKYESQNKMSVPNLAIVFSMNFLPQHAMDQMSAMQQVVRAMINNADKIFP